MNEVLPNQQEYALPSDHPGTGRRVCIMGVPLGFGSSLAGVDIGPAALRVARINQRIAQLGYEVRDFGDMRIVRPQSAGEFAGKANYLHEISAACEEIAVEVHKLVSGGELPVILGGDHSIAIGSIAGVASSCRENQE